MIKGFYENLLNEGMEILEVPFNFVLRRKDDFFDISDDPNSLEDFTLFRIKKRTMLSNKIKEGIIKIVDIDENYLDRFRECVERKDKEAALNVAMDIFYSVRVKEGYFEHD